MLEEAEGQQPAGENVEEGYPLKETTALLNRQLGLYLSSEQQRGLAAGLLVGTAIAGAVIAWNVTSALRAGAE